MLQYKGEKVKKEIDNGLQNGEYVLIPKSNGMNIVGKLRRVDQDSSKFYSVLKHLNKNGVNELKELKVEFDYPKPSSLIKELVSGATFFLDRKESIVLDFFAGFRVIIMTQANSQVNTRVLELLPKFKIKKMNRWCAV